MPPPAPLSRSVPTKGKILVVDDDRLVLATLSHGLAQAGYEVIDADNGDDAILLARQHRPALALLDIRMQGKTGFDVAAYLKDYCQIPFMFLSAFADRDTVSQVAALGAVAYLVKPLDVGQIVPTVDAAFERLRGLKEQAPAANDPAARPPLPDSTPIVVIALAVGVLMHRYSLSRRDALERLQRMAGVAGVPLREQAERLVQAVEELSRTGAG
jgi:DNA-binding response OmpR family regulator